MGHCLWGGSHPYAEHFLTQLRSLLGEQAKGWNLKRIIAEFRAEIARMLAAERGEANEAIKDEME